MARPKAESIQITVSQLISDFAGRRGTSRYNDAKLYHIHRRNRAYVWGTEMEEYMIDSLLKGYYIPPIVACSSIENNRERRDIMDGGNRITCIDKILNNEVRPLTAEQRALIECQPITFVTLRNMSDRQKREMFRRLNKSVKVTDGQLYAMSEDDSPLVKEALKMLKDDTHPLRQDITDLFFDTRVKDNDGCTNLSNAVALLSGALNGPDYITKSFHRQETKVESTDPIEQWRAVRILRSVFDVFRETDRRHPLEDKRRRKGQWAVGRWLSVILYDTLMNPEQPAVVREKWASYLVKVRRGDPGTAALQSARIWGANLTADRHFRISTMVDIYLRDNRVLTKDELTVYRHPRPAGEEEAETSDTEEDNEYMSEED